MFPVAHRLPIERGAAVLLSFVVVCALSMGASGSTPADRWRLFNERQFSELDATLSAYQQRYEQTSASDPDVERDLAQVFRVFYYSDENALALYDDWVKASPQSYAASLARGEHLTALAKKRRGAVFWRDVTPEQREAMRREARRARIELERSLTLTAKPILSYQFLIEIAAMTSQREDKLRLIEEAEAVDAINYYPRSAFLFAIQPEWGGSIKEMHLFVDAYRELKPPTWKLNCLEAMVRERESLPRRSAYGLLQGLVKRLADWYYRDPKGSSPEDAADGAPERLNRAIELCPTPERLAKRGYYWNTHSRLDLAEKDYRRALELDPGYVWAQSALGSMLVVQGRSEEGAPLCRWAADRGDPAAQYCLGYTYAKGLTVAKDPGEAVHWMGRSADNGNVTAMTALGAHYWRGDGVSQDKAKAIELWRKAAARDDADAKKHLKEVGASR
jgi:TPR repeat protein